MIHFFHLWIFSLFQITFSLFNLRHAFVAGRQLKVCGILYMAVLCGWLYPYHIYHIPCSYKANQNAYLAYFCLFQPLPTGSVAASLMICMNCPSKLDAPRGFEAVIFPCRYWSGGFEWLYVLHKNRRSGGRGAFRRSRLRQLQNSLCGSACAEEIELF